MDKLKVGLKGHKEEMVTDENTAMKYGSGSVKVYATPAMIGLMEGASLSAVDPLLPDGMATVGISLEVKHLAASPIGLKVWCDAELVEIDGKRLVFKVDAYDEAEKIGEGTHQRFVVDLSKFLVKSAAKGNR
ncbi:MAG: thioesterase family protein [Heliobacteriaceae bacterium]|nr:thioesterase family protein [Heliobacteriaceae bacterium]